MSTQLKKQAPKLGATPYQVKTPRALNLPDNGLKPSFRFEKMDRVGKWGWNQFDPSFMQEFLTHFLDCEKKTWQELKALGSHHVDISKLIPEARKRLTALELDDRDELYSLRISSKQRVWCIKESSILWILWWDPNHEICPSYKKHT